jgi:hypothetical protein
MPLKASVPPPEEIGRESRGKYEDVRAGVIPEL